MKNTDGKNQFVSIGDGNNSYQNIQESKISTEEWERMLTSLKEDVLRISDERDIAVVEELSKEISQGNWAKAKQIFGFLAKAVQVSASGATLFKALSYTPI